MSATKLQTTLDNIGNTYDSKLSEELHLVFPRRVLDKV